MSNDINTLAVIAAVTVISLVCAVIFKVDGKDVILAAVSGLVGYLGGKQGGAE